MQTTAVPSKTTTTTRTNAAPATIPAASGSAAAPAAAAAAAAAAPQRRAADGPDRRMSQIDRRTGLERRQMTRAQSGYAGAERRSGDDRRDATGLERRRGPGRRRPDERRVAEEGEMNAHQFEFVMAVEAYKKVNKKLYPTWTEILEVLRQLGYRKVLARAVTLDAPEPDLFNGADPLPEPEVSDDDDDDDDDAF